MGEDADEAMALLADMTRATDARLRDLARRLAGRLMLDVARRGRTRPRGTGRIQTAPYHPDTGDLDIDASTEAIVEARAAGAALDPERLRVRRWVQPKTAVCLLVDRSGSMGGRPLATSAVAAAAVAFRAPDDFSVISFAKDCVVVKSQDGTTPVEAIVDGVLSLKGHGTTDLAGALKVAGLQLARSNAGRKIVVLLSDCRATEPGRRRDGGRGARRAGDRRPRRRRRGGRRPGRRGRRRADDRHRPERRGRGAHPRPELTPSVVLSFGTGPIGPELKDRSGIQRRRAQAGPAQDRRRDADLPPRVERDAVAPAVRPGDLDEVVLVAVPRRQLARGRGAPARASARCIGVAATSSPSISRQPPLHGGRATVATPPAVRP